MPVSFPHLDHVPLRNPPIQEVICQVKFPIILRIGQEVPALFQEAVRERFPVFDTEQGVQFESVPGQLTAKPLPSIHRFSDKDRVHTASLGVDFYALSTTRYTGWQTFVSDLRFVSEAVLSTYNIPYSTRIGLRYINSLTVENTKSRSFYPDVVDMLRPEITALLLADAIQEPFMGLTNIRVKQGDGVFSFQSGVFKEGEKPEQFMLDFDQYVEAELDFQIEALLERCEQYHALIYDAFRWCIRADKITTFDPVE